jgi:heme exporter protein D
MLPLAHVGHYFIWVLYAVPVLIVAGAIVKSMIAQRRYGDDDEERA